MRTKTGWILLVLPTILVGLILIILLNWHRPTRIKIILKTDKISFKVGGEDKTIILDSVGLSSIIIEEFESVKLKPESLIPLVASKDSGRLTSRSPTTGLKVKQLPVVITGKGGRSQSNVTLTKAEGGQQSLLAMDSVGMKPASEVTLETTNDPGDLIVHVDGQQTSGKITVAEPIKLAIDQCEIAGISGNLKLDEPLIMRVKLFGGSSIEFNGRQNSLILTVTVPTEKAASLFPQGHIPVTDIKFERLDGQSGRLISSLLKNSSGEITYPDYQGKVDKVTVSSPDFLSLGDLQNFNIEEITYDAEHKGISMTLQGIADKVMSGSADYNKDHRLTAYHAIWHNYKVVTLFAALCWMAGTTAAFYKFFKEK